MGRAFQFFATLTGAAIGGIIAALVTGDALAFVVALAVGPFVYVVAGAALVPDSPEPPTRATYARVLALAVAAAATGLSYVFIGAWLAVIAVVLLVAAIVFAVFAMMSGA
jgi:hypothetical protein